MKKVFLVLTIFALATKVSAQDNTTTSATTTTRGAAAFSIAANAGFSTASIYKLAYGADVQGDFPLAQKLSLTGSVGYEVFHWKLSSGSTSYEGNTSQIPLLAGLKTLLSTNLYAHAQAGYSVKGNTSSAQANQLGFANGNGFAFALSAGYNTRGLDLAVKYLATKPEGSHLGAIVFRAGFRLGGK